jgi:four helix bundle protein
LKAQGAAIMAATAEEFKARTKKFAVRTIRLVDSLKNRRSTEVIALQLLRSATSVGPNYRAAGRGRSDAKFVAKLGIVKEEADESAYWMELFVEAEIVKQKMIANLHQDANEIVAMVVASIKTTRARISNGKRRFSD